MFILYRITYRFGNFDWKNELSFEMFAQIISSIETTRELSDYFSKRLKTLFTKLSSLFYNQYRDGLILFTGKLKKWGLRFIFSLLSFLLLICYYSPSSGVFCNWLFWSIMFLHIIFKLQSFFFLLIYNELLSKLFIQKQNLLFAIIRKLIFFQFLIAISTDGHVE